jgi:hypothetical protein
MGGEGGARVGKVRTARVWRWAGARDREERDLCQRVAVCFFKSRIMDDIFFCQRFGAGGWRFGVGIVMG